MRVKRWLYKRGAIMTVIFAGMSSLCGVAAAQIASVTDVADSVVKVAGVEPLLACCWILGIVASICAYFTWRQSQVIVEQQKTMTELAHASSAQLSRLVDALNARPCVYAQRPAIPEHTIDK